MLFLNCIKYVLVTFLLIFVRPLYSASLPVDIYGSYNYNDKSLSIFWKSKTIYDSFKIDFYLTTYNDTLPCGSSPTLTLKAATTIGYSSTNITFTNVPDGKYRVNIHGLLNNGSTTFVITQDFFITATSKNYTLGWCNINDSNFIYTGTTTYNTEVPSFDFGSSESVTNWQNSMLSKVTQYFNVKNMLFVNNGYNTDTPNIPIVSPASAQVITYTVIPDKPTWIGLTH